MITIRVDTDVGAEKRTVLIMTLIYARDRCVPRRILRRWKENVMYQKELRWKEFRKQLLRQKVKGMLSHSRLNECMERESITNNGDD